MYRAKNKWFPFGREHTDLLPDLRLLAEMLAGIGAAVNSRMAGAISLRGLSEQDGLRELRVDPTAMMTVYETAVGYNHHLDGYIAQRNKRALTVLAYLNSDWAEGDGGELRVFQSGAPPIDYAPIAGRVILFKSKEVFHAVLPCARPGIKRCAIQLWLLDE